MNKPPPLALIAEDDENSRVLLEDALSSRGYTVLSAADGVEALKLARQEPPHIIISDILMPTMDGYDLCYRVKQDPRLSSVPFVFYTATYTDPKDQNLALSLGAARFIVKPIEMSVFLTMVEEVLAAVDSGGVSDQPSLPADELQALHAQRMQAKLTKKLQELESKSQRLEASERRFRDFAEASADWFWEADASLRILTASGGPPDLVSENLISLLERQGDLEEYREVDIHALRAIENRQAFQDLIVDFHDRNRRPMALRISAKPLFDRCGRFEGYRGVARDVSETVALSRRVEYLATHDDLTGLPNRSLFREKLSQALSRAHRSLTQVILFFIDLDHFKLVNDTLGHDAGDTLLLEAAQRIARHIRASDTLARLGGDEFVLILEGAAPNDAHRIAQDILKSFELPILIGEQKVFVTASIGLSVYPDDTVQPQTLVTYADLAMYRAKEKGRNNFQYYTDGLNAAAFEWMAMESGLRNALKNHELFLMYQPQVNLENGRLEGVEALLRWRHPEFGLVLPDKFIPIAEQSTLIVALGEWVLDSVCRQVTCWDEEGIFVPRVSVNISARHIRNNRICEDARRILTSHRIPTARVCLEITEHTLLESAETIQASLDELREWGMYLSLDDFGTGYSSLSYLKRFSVHELKIDRSFVDGVATQGDDHAIAKAIIALGRALGMQVVGEGVETRGQAEALRKEGCCIAQGYYFSKPLSPEELRLWVAGRASPRTR